MKRLLAFALLLVAGFLLLRLALGDEALATGGKQRDPGGSEPRMPPVTGQPIRVQRDGTELQVRGPFEIAPVRRVPLPDGGATFQSTYELSCRDSAPLDGTRQRLDDVTIKLFDQGEHVADLRASHAIVALEVDEHHERSLRQDTEISLDDAVFTTLPGGKLPPLRVDVGQVLATVDEDVIALRTPDEHAPVHVVVDGSNKGEITGRGLQARMPKKRGAAFGRLDLLVLHDPTIVMAGVHLVAKGRLHYVEQLATGAALLTVDDDVHVDLAGARRLEAVADGRSSNTDIQGDRLHGWLQRSRHSGAANGATDRDALVWTMLRLLGARAKVTTSDLELESPRLTVLPGPTGELASITADGGPSELRRAATATSNAATFRSPRPIHLLRPGSWSGAVHRQFGFPAASLGALRDLEIVTFDGASDVDAGDGVRVIADRGLHLFRQQATATNGRVVVLGFGNVTVARRDGDQLVELSGDSGFELRRTDAGDCIVLGRADPTANQRFRLQRGALQVRGSGACRLEREPDGTTHVRLASDRPTIGGEFADGAQPNAVTGHIRAARTLQLDTRDRELCALLATGVDTVLEFEQKGRRLVATTARIEQLAPNSWRLTGTTGKPAHLQLPALGDEGSTGELTAPRIDLHRLAASSLLVDAMANDDGPARLDARLLPPKATAPVAIATTAQRVRLLPFAVGPAAWTRHLLGLAPALAHVAAIDLDSAWLLADGEVVTEVIDPVHGDLHAKAHRLAASQGTRALLLSGDPATRAPARLERRQDGESSIVAEGARVRVVAEDDQDQRVTVLTTFPGETEMLPPRVTFRGAPSAEVAPGQPLPSASGWIRGECHGEVEVGPDAVLFHGPVTANSLLADGRVDPDGMHITAQTMQMNRLKDSGALSRVIADGGVLLDWRQLHAISRRVELNLSWNRCIAEDPAGAEIRFGTKRFVAPRLEANYATYSVRWFEGNLTHAAEPVTIR